MELRALQGLCGKGKGACLTQPLSRQEACREKRTGELRARTKVVDLATAGIPHRWGCCGLFLLLSWEITGRSLCLLTLTVLGLQT